MKLSGSLVEVLKTLEGRRVTGQENAPESDPDDSGVQGQGVNSSCSF